MGCTTSSLLLSDTDAWKHCAGDVAADEDVMEWTTSYSSPPSLPCGYPSQKSAFNLEKLHPSEPPYLGSAYWLPSTDHVRNSRIKTPPPLLTVSPSESSLFSERTCSTSDKTLVMSNRNYFYEEEESESVGSITPKSLFQDDTEDESLSRTSSQEESQTSPALIHHGVLIKGRVESSPRNISPRRRRRINTLPSFESGRPIRLRIVESYRPADDCSFDPYFGLGEYQIQTSNGSPYGNVLSVQMGPQNMTLQDGNGHVIAVMRSRHTTTSEPSWIVYGPKPRFASQTKSDAVPTTTANNNYSDSWYAWALVKKDGPLIRHEVSLHVYTRRGWGPAVYKGRHGFVGNAQTHTVVTRVATNEMSEVPCCFVLRDPVHVNAFHLTIAPGIDPLLLICYLAVHSKMDVEPLMAAS